MFILWTNRIVGGSSKKKNNTMTIFVRIRTIFCNRGDISLETRKSNWIWFFIWIAIAQPKQLSQTNKSRVNSSVQDNGEENIFRQIIWRKVAPTIRIRRYNTLRGKSG